MTGKLETTTEATFELPDDSDRFDRVSMVLHWLTVVLIVIQFSSVWSLRIVDEKSALGFAILNTHQSSGVLVWVIGLARLLWRHNFAYLPPFPKSMPKLQQTIAKANEYSLYVLLLVQPITGLGRVLLRGHPFSLFFWEVPPLLEPNDHIRHLLVEAHELGANLLLALIAFHVAAALFHRLVLRDSVLQRMLPRMSVRTKLTPTLAKSEAE
jgi:superoxide oxidase